MATPMGLRTIQKFPKTLGLAFVQGKADAAKEDGATSATFTDDGTNYVLTIDWPPLDDGQNPPAAPGGHGAVNDAVVAGAPHETAPPPRLNHALAFSEAIVQHWEGCSLVVYHGKADRPNVWTIGWGCIAIDGTPVNPNTAPITQQRADELLANELAGSQAAVRRQIAAPLTEFQEAALISFTYNLGEG